MKDLKIIHPDKTRVFYTPLHPNIVRTGTVGDGSCFFHALLYSISGSYRKLSVPDRVNYVSKVRQKIAKSVDRMVWKNLGNGEVFRLQFVSQFREHILRYVQSLPNSPYTVQHWDDIVLSEVCNKWKSVSLNDCRNIILNIVPDTDEDNLQQIIERTEDQIFQGFQHHVQNAWVDEFLMELVSDFFKCNFYFINATNRQVYTMIQPRHQYDKNVVFCWMEETHYECLGELHSDHTVTRVFKNNHPFIINIKMS